MKRKLAIIFRILWFLSMASFLATFLGFSIYQNNTKVYSGITVAWLISIGVGIIFYLLYFFFKTKSVKNGNKAFKQVVIQGIIALVLCVVAMPVGAKTLEFTGIVKKTPTNSQITLPATPSPESLELKNTQWKNGIFQGEIQNKNSKPVYNIQIALRVSKSRDEWKIDEEHFVTIPYKVDPGQTVSFKEKITTPKVNPWWTALPTSSLYYTGQNTPTQPPIATVNPDPITDCVSLYPNCNGESIRLRQSQCKNITCCGFRNGIWKVYPSTEKCIQAQNGEQATQQVQKPTVPTNQLNFYCYDNTLKYSYYTSSGEQCNKDNASSACKAFTKSTMYDPCMQKCSDTSTENINICGWAYLGSHPSIEYSESLYQECVDENAVEHQTCMDACSGPYQEALKKCY